MLIHGFLIITIEKCVFWRGEGRKGIERERREGRDEEREGGREEVERRDDGVKRIN